MLIGEVVLVLTLFLRQSHVCYMVYPMLYHDLSSFFPTTSNSAEVSSKYLVFHPIIDNFGVFANDILVIFPWYLEDHPT